MSWQTAGWLLGGVATALAVLCATPMANVVLWSPTWLQGRIMGLCEFK